MTNPNEMSYNGLVKKIQGLQEAGKDVTKYEKRLEFLKLEFAKGFGEKIKKEEEQE